MKIIIPGGSGQLGSVLSRHFLANDHSVVILTRSTTPNSPASKVRHVQWDAKSPGAWADELEDADVVINLVGRSVNCRYNQANRKLILDSRVDSTRAIGNAIRTCQNPPRVWLQSSTATIYAHRFDQPNDEQGIIGGDEPDVPETWRFSIEVAKAWEAAANEFQDLPTRTVLMRTAMVMSPDRDGVFDVLLGLVKKGLGGRNGTGNQYVSWIHELDFVRALDWLIERSDLDGPINLAAPNPIPNTQFMKTLREVAGVRFGLPATRWMLELGAVLMKTETELILKSRRVIPGKLLESGFEFLYATWDQAATELFTRWKRRNS